jgi:hypothetical protein
MRTVFLVTSSTYSDCLIPYAFTDRGDAEAFMQSSPESSWARLSVEEMSLFEEGETPTRNLTGGAYVQAAGV